MKWSPIEFTHSVTLGLESVLAEQKNTMPWACDCLGERGVESSDNMLVTDLGTWSK